MFLPLRRLAGFSSLALAMFAAPFVLACATSFTGSAHFPGGPAACNAQCQQNGMAFGGFVYAGEYSSACVCEPRFAPGVQAQASEPRTAGAVQAAVGVMEQQRRAQQQQQAQR